jgi:hypothetical protein
MAEATVLKNYGVEITLNGMTSFPAEFHENLPLNLKGIIGGSQRRTERQTDLRFHKRLFYFLKGSRTTDSEIPLMALYYRIQRHTSMSEVWRHFNLRIIRLFT